MGFETVDEYVATLPEQARESMARLREFSRELITDLMTRLSARADALWGPR